MQRGAWTVACVVALAAGLTATSSVSALDWPVKQRALTATFGENRWNHFHDGIDIGGGPQAVHPSADGQVLFTYDEGQNPRDLPTGLGSFVVLQNGPQLRTLYAHLRRGSVVTKKTVTPSDVIGVMGDTGDSVGRHLHFEIINSAKGEIVNPLTLLPPLADNVRPVIRAVSIERGKTLTPLRPRMTVDNGQVALVVDTYDPSQYVQYFDPMSPYQIEATLNGKQILHVTYDALKNNGGTEYLLPSDHRDFKSYYLGTWAVRLGTFSLETGAAHLTVLVRDIAGNEVSRSFELRVLGKNGK